MTDAEILGHDKITMRDMIDACRYEAHRIDGSQKALVEGLMRAAPDPEALRRRDVLDATANFIERFAPHFHDFKQYIGRQRFGGRRK